jgi:hypothetical protein
MPLLGAAENKCPSCGSTNGAAISKETFLEGFQRGAFFNIDPRTGKRLKKKKRR